MKKNIRLLGMCGMIICLSACSGTNKIDNAFNTLFSETTYDIVSCPPKSGEANYESIVSYSEIKSRFDARTSEVENQNFLTKIATYSTEDKNKLTKKIAENIAEFRDGGTIYELDEALDMYKNALILSHTSDNKDDDYHYIGFQTYHSILQIYGAEYVEGGTSNGTLGIRQACLRLQELGFLDGNYKPINN